ncbi:MAG TPA: AbrB/MazE/SpoVT family DNA-binding domain-containing protein [Kiritimatiellia bacterium]|nr:AbrB/MazE/SpoVT family DNA-binding domain-containing protein [Kiritimatiellia bacterium]HMP00301.1 AbrB/MazE/SpoVT family DNA-binding domain-containing protein [Kiritimatiellia bacterium]
MIKTLVQIARIGNSKGIRIPSGILKRYRFHDAVIMEEKIEGILLRPAGPTAHKLSWPETARQMATEAESWKEWDSTLSDGLDTLTWTDGVAMAKEKRSRYGKTKPTKRS